MPEATDRNCGVVVDGKPCGKIAHEIVGHWFPLQDFGQLFFFCNEHYEKKDELRRLLGDGYAHLYEKI
jgi:hypothetical protein